MKFVLTITLFLIFLLPLSAQVPAPVSQDTGETIVMTDAEKSSSDSTEEKPEYLSGEKHSVTIPSAKRPKKGDGDKISELDSGDTEEDKKKRRDTIRFGLESEIEELIDELTKKEDVRYADDIYDLFQ
ncbi:MAG: hypothetical protein II684_05240, partial [Treponema sp.]|nr:hypothetical protein [Treponema sp.]